MNPQEQQLTGLTTEADKKYPIPMRTWNAIKLALWRSKVAWQIAARGATEILGRCKHADGCPGKTVETEPCRFDCPDRETRLSALVILNAARQFAPVDAVRPADAPYFAPSRETFSEVIAELAASQAEIEELRKRVIQVVVPPPNGEEPEPVAAAALPTTPAPPQLEGGQST